MSETGNSSWVGYLVTGLLGAGAGAVLSWFLTKKKEYKRFNEEIENARNFYEEKRDREINALADYFNYDLIDIRKILAGLPADADKAYEKEKEKKEETKVEPKPFGSYERLQYSKLAQKYDAEMLAKESESNDIPDTYYEVPFHEFTYGEPDYETIELCYFTNTDKLMLSTEKGIAPLDAPFEAKIRKAVNFEKIFGSRDTIYLRNDGERKNYQVQEELDLDFDSGT